LEIDLKPDLLTAILALLVSGCDAPSKPASTAVQTTTGQDADFDRMATAGKMLSDLHTYLGSGDPAPRTFTFDRLTFEPKSSVIRPVDQPSIHTLAVTLQNNPDVRARILGFGDGERSGTNNNSLGLQRATAVLVALGNAGVHPSRLEAAAGRETNRQRPAQLIILQK
jgi:outer membrane protein OmpA-like peptidoglycan-associated protein